MDEPLVFSAAFEAGERLRSFIKLLLIKDSISFFLAAAAGLGLDFLSVDAIMSGLCSVQHTGSVISRLKMLSVPLTAQLTKNNFLTYQFY